MVSVSVADRERTHSIRHPWSPKPRELHLVGDSGTLLSPVVVLLLFGAGVFLLLVVVMTWASSQAPK
jgi:hypothetical protein